MPRDFSFNRTSRQLWVDSLIPSSMARKCFSPRSLTPISRRRAYSAPLSSHCRHHPPRHRPNDPYPAAPPAMPGIPAPNDASIATPYWLITPWPPGQPAFSKTPFRYSQGNAASSLVLRTYGGTKAVKGHRLSRLGPYLGNLHGSLSEWRVRAGAHTQPRPCRSTLSECVASNSCNSASMASCRSCLAPLRSNSVNGSVSLLDLPVQ